MKCPSCGLEIPDDTVICPYCTAHVKKRVRIKTLYILALSLIIVSSVYATLAYTNSGVGVSKIANLSIDDNYRFVHVQGTVTGYPFAYETPYGVSQIGFTISDGTGQLTVKIYSNLVAQAVKEHKVPGLGDWVDVQGTFSYGTRKSLTVNDLYLLQIKHTGYSEENVNSIASATPWTFKNNEPVTLKGNITGVRQYSFGYIATIDNRVDLLIPKAYTALNMLNLRELGSGVVQFYGALLFYQPVKPSSDYTTVNLSEVMKAPESYNRTNVHIPWADVLAKNDTAGTLLIRANETNITVYAKDVRRYRVGDHVEIQGKFVNYHGEWEISVLRKTDFITTPSWEVVAHPSFKVIEKKSYVNETPERLNSLVRISGVVADFRPLSSGYLITLWSNNSSYSVYVENVMSVSGALNSGEKIVVKGMVTEYNGALEIKVRAYTDDSVEVIA
ncbi:MAG: zinc-ribbon domain-containing protein [Euryarchaeota archaeon]|nr:zinc-ribbon domain-containing protein [Euryarchaeota archaeon]